MYRLLFILFISVVSPWPLYSFSAVNGFSADSVVYRSDAVQQDKPYMSKEFDISKGGLLKVFTVGGNIDVVPSEATDRVKVELYLDRGFAFWSNANNLDNFRITMLQRGNEIIATVERKKRDTGFFSDRMSFSFKVYVPETISSELKTLAGNISIEEVHGRQMVKTGGGNITLSDISGHLQAYTAGGNISINDSQGILYAQTEGGNIAVDRSSGELRFKTRGGRIVSERLSGTLLAQVGGGDIHADFMRVGEGINLETSAGNIQVTVPDQIGYKLFLRGTKVLFNREEQLEGVVEPGRIEGLFKDSGPPINLQTNAGTVTLRIK